MYFATAAWKIGEIFIQACHVREEVHATVPGRGGLGKVRQRRRGQFPKISRTPKSFSASCGRVVPIRDRGMITAGAP